MNQVFTPEGKAITAAMAVWSYARFQKGPIPYGWTYNEALEFLINNYGLEAVLMSLNNYDRELYIQKGWEAALPTISNGLVIIV